MKFSSNGKWRFICLLNNKGLRFMKYTLGSSSDYSLKESWYLLMIWKYSWSYLVGSYFNSWRNGFYLKYFYSTFLICSLTYGVLLWSGKLLGYCLKNCSLSVPDYSSYLSSSYFILMLVSGSTSYSTAFVYILASTFVSS